MNLQPIIISDYDKGGLQTNVKPFMLIDQAFQNLYNAYVWRGRVKKREGLKNLGRLRRILTNLGQTATPGGLTYTDTDLLDSVRATEPNAEIQPNTVTIKVDAGGANETIYRDVTFKGRLDWISGPFTGSGVINYNTGAITITFLAPIAGGLTVTSNLSYYPSLPVMGEEEREIVAINDEEEIFFDTKYAYKYSGTGFQEFITGFQWAGTDADFFWMTNYRGSAPEDRLFFETNFSDPASSANNRMRYVDQAAVAWVDFTPIVADVPESAAQSTLWMARILIPYYGRLLALNVYEGNTAGAAVNIPNRCRFSQIGSPIASDAWRSDKFGKGGFIDAPTIEKIISARFFKNTLIVGFERSTWQLRYVGEYGLPFIWERISSDFGTESTFSTVLFDDGVLQVGDKAITAATAVNVSRIDLQIPDIVFNSIRNADDGQERVFGIRDFQRELVFWNYSNASDQRKFPNRSLVYNYRNNTYAIFRNNVTIYGTFQPEDGITWDRTDIFWDDEDVTWDDYDVQSQFPFIVSGNQQGWVHYYGYITQDEPSLTVQSINLAVSPIVITSPNHNLETGEIIMLTDLAFTDAVGTPVSTNLNNRIFRVIGIDADTFGLSEWDGSAYVVNFSFTPAAGSATYVGNGKITLFPQMVIETKDFNPFQKQGGQAKLSYVDFLVDATPSGAISVQLYANTSPAVLGNLLVGNTQSESYLTTPYYTPASDIAWHRFYATLAAQYFRILMSYDDDLMNTLATHQQTFVLNAMNLWVKQGGRLVF